MTASLNTNNTTAASWTRATTKAQSYMNVLKYKLVGGYLKLRSPQSGEVHVCTSDSCDCVAYERGNACWHIAAYRLLASRDRKCMYCNGAMQKQGWYYECSECSHCCHTDLVAIDREVC